MALRPALEFLNMRRTFTRKTHESYSPSPKAFSAFFAFAASIAAGLSQLFMLTWLNHNLNESSFSRISTIIQSFPVFFVIVEMGIQGEIIRRLSSDQSPALFSQVLLLRLLASLITLASIAVYGIVAGFSSEMYLGLLGFSLAHIPAGILLTLEDWGFGKGKMACVILPP